MTHWSPTVSRRLRRVPSSVFVTGHKTMDFSSLGGSQSARGSGHLHGSPSAVFCHGVQGVAGSNPAVPTNRIEHLDLRRESRGGSCLPPCLPNLIRSSRSSRGVSPLRPCGDGRRLPGVPRSAQPGFAANPSQRVNLRGSPRGLVYHNLTIPGQGDGMRSMYAQVGSGGRRASDRPIAGGGEWRVRRPHRPTVAHREIVRHGTRPGRR